MRYLKIDDMPVGQFICKKWLAEHHVADLQEKIIEMVREFAPKGTYIIGVELEVVFDVHYEPGKRPDDVLFKSWTVKGSEGHG